MSLVLIYHDSKRAVIAADERITGEDATGTPVRIGLAPKFCTLPGPLILACTGQSWLTHKLLVGTMHLMADFPKTTFAELAPRLQFTCEKMWADRPPTQILPKFRNLQATLIGFDAVEGKMRCISWFSNFDFKPYESADPNSAILTAGFFEESDQPALQELTDLMAFAPTKGIAWVAAQLRRTADKIAGAHRDYIDPATNFAAVDRNGVIALPPEFPLPDFGAQGAQAGVCTTINISAFTMRSGNTDLSLNSGSVTALAYNTLYYVFHDDPAFSGGAVTYSSTTVKENALASENRYFDGSILTPRAGALDTKGNNDGGSGSQDGLTSILGMSSVTTPGILGNGSVTNPLNALDGDDTTYAEVKVTLDGTGNHAAIVQLQGPPAITQRYSSVSMRIVWSVPQNDGTTTNVELYIWDTVTQSKFYDNLVSAGVTFGKTELNVSLPLGTNLSRYYVNLGAISGGSPTGAIRVRLHEATILATG